MHLPQVVGVTAGVGVAVVRAITRDLLPTLIGITLNSGKQVWRYVIDPDLRCDLSSGLPRPWAARDLRTGEQLWQTEMLPFLAGGLSQVPLVKRDAVVLRPQRQRRRHSGPPWLTQQSRGTVRCGHAMD